MWTDRQVVVRLVDSIGFERSLLRISSELAIRNRARPGERLEDGLTPMMPKHANELLRFTDEQNLIELHYFLSLGVLSGARVGTIYTLGVRHIEDAVLDVSMPGFCRVRVGPGTGVKTKFDVSGDLLIPVFLIEVLRGYSYSMRRIQRQALASEANRGLLFLTVRGNPYEHSTFGRLMTDLRRRAGSNGMHFMKRFKFHQTRATYGTMLMELALNVTDANTALAFVSDAMLHKDEITTLGYLRFVQQTPVKALIGKEFSELFSGVVNRSWNQFHA